MDDAGRIGFLIKGDYDSEILYNFLDIVYYEGSSYVAKKITSGNSPERDNEFWHIFAEGGGTYGKDVIDTMQKTIDALVEKVGGLDDDIPEGYTKLLLSDGSNLITDSGETVIVTE